jgi:hypothetical protein
MTFPSLPDGSERIAAALSAVGQPAVIASGDSIRRKYLGGIVVYGIAVHSIAIKKALNRL